MNVVVVVVVAPAKREPHFERLVGMLYYVCELKPVRHERVGVFLEPPPHLVYLAELRRRASRNELIYVNPT